jgi:hypothetical protein
MGRLLGVGWSKAALVGVGESAFVSTGIYPLNPNTISEYFFSIFNTSEITTSMERAPRNMASISKNLAFRLYPSSSVFSLKKQRFGS